MKTIMKKIISGILIVASLLLCLCGCSLLDKFICTDSNTETPDNNEVVQFAGTPVANDSDMIKAIIQLLHDLSTDIYPLPSDIVYKLRSIEYYRSPFLKISFDPFENYFVCGYSVPEKTQTLRPNERAQECDWFIFESADKILEYYNEEKCIFAFQFNKSYSVSNLLSDGGTPNVEHFIEYNPQFEHGFNVAPPLLFTETIFYVDISVNKQFDYSAEKINYYSISSPLHNSYTLSTMEIDGADCVRINRRRNSDGEIYSLESMLGEYYDVFVQEARLDEFQLSLTDNNTFIITLITMDDFIKVAKVVTTEN